MFSCEPISIVCCFSHLSVMWSYLLMYLVIFIECRTFYMKSDGDNLRPWMMLSFSREDFCLWQLPRLGTILHPDWLNAIWLRCFTAVHESLWGMVCFFFTCITQVYLLEFHIKSSFLIDPEFQHLTFPPLTPVSPSNLLLSFPTYSVFKALSYTSANIFKGKMV